MGVRLPGVRFCLCGGDDPFFAALRARFLALRRSLGRLRGVRFCLCGGDVSFFLPCGHRVSPSGEVGTPARRAVSPARRWIIGFFCPLGISFRPPAKFGTPARRAARRGRLWGYAPFSAPLASPPKHPLRGTSNFRWGARARVLCCGSFPPSLRSLR